MKCKFEHDGYCCNCGSPHFKAYCQPVDCGFSVPLTNADRIRSMSDEEMAEFISSIPMCVGKDEDLNCEIDVCKECFLKWLRQPAEEDDHDA